jgi:hypothetical protein
MQRAIPDRLHDAEHVDIAEERSAPLDRGKLHRREELFQFPGQLTADVLIEVKAHGKCGDLANHTRWSTVVSYNQPAAGREDTPHFGNRSHFHVGRQVVKKIRTGNGIKGFVGEGKGFSDADLKAYPEFVRRARARASATIPGVASMPMASIFPLARAAAVMASLPDPHPTSQQAVRSGKLGRVKRRMKNPVELELDIGKGSSRSR